MSFLALVVLVMFGYVCFLLWKIANSLGMIAACIGFDEMKKAGVLEELRASTISELKTAGGMEQIIAAVAQQRLAGELKSIT